MPFHDINTFFPYFLIVFNNASLVYSDSPLDLKIKSHLVSDMFNLIGE